MIGTAFRKIADEAPSMLWVADSKGNPTFFNKAWLQFRGTTLQEEVVCEKEDRVYQYDLVKLQKKFEESLGSRRPYKIEYRLKRHDGNYRWIIENGIPNFDEHGHFAGFIGSCMDIHNIKELEKRKEEFITAASHELKTPLTSLTVFLHLIDEYFAENRVERYKAYSEGAVQQLNKITSLVERFLDINKIQSGSLNYIYTDFVMSELVSNIVDKIKLLYPQRTVAFVSGSNGLVKGDIEKMSHAIENLLYNALKYSADNTEVCVEVHDAKNFVTVDVIDYGIGIAKAYQTKIFERFYRIPGKHEETYPGMGMGLYLTKKIVEKHNGKVNVESCENKGTVFSVKIPILNRHEQAYG